jgi:hypothetical protein
MDFGMGFEGGVVMEEGRQGQGYLVALSFLKQDRLATA